MRNKLIAAFACTSALVGAGAASAADLAARPYTKCPDPTQGILQQL